MSNDTLGSLSTVKIENVFLRKFIDDFVVRPFTTLE